jgi:hypothetical protein
MAWNQWRSQKEAHVDLSKADLSRLRLNRANLSGVDLAKARLVETRFSEADLSGADIGGADLTGAHLREADLRGTNLSKADLSRADFSRADLSQADLNGTNFSRANLRETNLSDAGIANTMFVDVDLSLTNGLDSVFHQGPSSIGIDTVFRSKGQIPDSFLHGCGVGCFHHLCQISDRLRCRVLLLFHQLLHQGPRLRGSLVRRSSSQGSSLLVCPT